MSEMRSRKCWPHLNNDLVMINPLDLTGSVIMVTGASAGIGKSTSQLLSRLGARVVLVSRTPATLTATVETLEGDGHIIAPFDFNKPDEIEQWFKTLVHKTGPLNGLIHCAGAQLLRPLKLLSSMEIESLLRLNVTSGLILAKAFRQKNHHASPASIVFISSAMGQVGAIGRSVYCASKASVIGMTKALALELVSDGIRVNCVAPGFVVTGMLKEIENTLGEACFAEIRKMHPLGFGDPLDVANAVAFLLANTSRWITGTTLFVDGGYTAQ